MVRAPGSAAIGPVAGSTATTRLRVRALLLFWQRRSLMTAATDRVRSHTAQEILRRIDDQTRASLLQCAEKDSPRIAERMGALEREWDTDRALETEAATLGLVGLALGVLVRPVFLAIPVVVAANVLLHASTGRYPLMPLFRRLRLRTAREIARERYAIKALRGDLSGLRETARAAAHAAPSRPAP